MARPYDPVAKRARNRLWNAIWYRGFKRGNTCEACDARPAGRSQIRGHIADYSKPLDVRWMCASCHNLYHSALRRSGQQGEAA